MEARQGDNEFDLDWWTMEEVAKSRNVSRGTISAYLARGQMPPPDAHVGRTPLWRPATIKDWNSKRTRKKPSKGTAYTTAPICDACWLRSRNRVPHRVAESLRVEEPCYRCQTITISGIYVRVKESEL